MGDAGYVSFSRRLSVVRKASTLAVAASARWMVSGGLTRVEARRAAKAIAAVTSKGAMATESEVSKVRL